MTYRYVIIYDNINQGAITQSLLAPAQVAYQMSQAVLVFMSASRLMLSAFHRHYAMKAMPFLFRQYHKLEGQLL